MPGNNSRSNGWVKLHRQITECPALAGNGERWAWADLILLAAHKPVSVVVNLGDFGVYHVELRRGEFCCGLGALAHRWSWARLQVQRFISKLLREGMIARRPDAGVVVRSQADLFDSWLTGGKGLGSDTGVGYRVPALYAIVKYDLYQGNESQADTGFGYTIQEVYSTNSLITEEKTKNKNSLELSTSKAPSKLPADPPGRLLLRELGEVWNSLPGLIHHRGPALRAFDRKLSKALDLFGADTLKLAFARYSLWRVNSQGRYRPAYSWTLGEFVSRSDGSHVARLASDAWESGCLPFANETQEQANLRAAARARAARASDEHKAGDKGASSQGETGRQVSGERPSSNDEGPAWLRWGQV